MEWGPSFENKKMKNKNIKQSAQTCHVDWYADIVGGNVVHTPHLIDFDAYNGHDAPVLEPVRHLLGNRYRRESCPKHL